MAEIDFALARVRELRWVDQTNLFLMGHGEGGDYAARYDGPEFRGQVASGAVCARGQGRQSPLLVIVAKDDAVLKGTPTKCRGVDGFEAIAGSTHQLWVYPEARRALLDFLLGHMNWGG